MHKFKQRNFLLYTLDLCVAPQPLGMESSEIPDNAITASSFFNFHYKPFYARLRKNGEECTWEPTALGRSNSWLQVDLGKLAIITGIATQGTCYNISEWTNSYSVSYSKDGNNWAYFQESGSVKVNRLPHYTRLNIEFT